MGTIYDPFSAHRYLDFQGELSHVTLARGAALTKTLCATEQGFSLHAATTASADDVAGREALCKYILRPPLSQDRVQLVPGDLVRLVLKRPFSDETFALDLQARTTTTTTACSVARRRTSRPRIALGIARGRNC